MSETENVELENSEVLFKERKEKRKKIIFAVIPSILFAGIIVLWIISSVRCEKNYILMKEYFEANNYQEVLHIISRAEIRNYKDTSVFYEASYSAIKAQENEEKYQKVLEAHSKMKQIPFKELEDFLLDAISLEVEDYKDSGQMASDFSNYFTLAEEIWNDYADIAYEHALDMSTNQVEKYAQNVLSKKYDLSGFEIQRIYIWWHDYVAESGLFVHYDD
ncbi:hypothetical protein CE91St44_22440 [Oscillospiraceae bacterium]|nr:hypothetical protein CE91St44_13360 [Oscillospiraceae bacterium]GKI15083.1 hypothetical protein CE91St44_15680 [Oscillospiraceae bacterium]GKI15759.1 hypothetical protein CE91St44_22440 [Oscillospiraceae bacterium]